MKKPGTGLIFAAAADEPGLDGAGIFEDFVLKFLKLAFDDYAFDGCAERFIAGLAAFLLDEGEDRLSEFQPVLHAAHILSS